MGNLLCIKFSRNPPSFRGCRPPLGRGHAFRRAGALTRARRPSSWAELNGNAGAGVDQQPRAEWGLRITRSVPNIEELRSHVSREREEIARCRPRFNTHLSGSAMCSADGSTYYIGQSSPRTMQWPIAALRGHLRLHLNGLLQRQQGTPDQRGKPHVPPFTATRAAQLALGWTALATIAAETKGQKGIRSL